MAQIVAKAAKRKLEVRFVADKSGSMYSWRRRVVEGSNAYLGRMRNDSRGKTAYLRLVTFDSMGTDVLRQGLGGEIADLKYEEYVPRALTPLYDNLAAALNDNIEQDTDYVVVLFTDGIENASKGEFSQLSALRALVERKQKAGTIVIYLGANIDAWQQAEPMGIPKERVMNVHVQGNNQPAAKSSWFGKGKGGGSNPVAMAFVAAAGLGLAYHLLAPGSAQASSLGFSEADRNEAMGVDGVSKTWEQAVQEDVSGFDEPLPDMFSLPADLQQEIALLPADFDPTKGSLDANGEQTGGFETDGDVHDEDDLEALQDGNSGDDSSDADSSYTQPSHSSSEDSTPSWGGGSSDSGSNDSGGGFDFDID